jgi:hypothetical protein
MTISRRGLWLLCIVVALALAGLVSSISAHADDETFFAGSSSCPIAHCNQHLDGREGLTIPVTHQPSTYATYTPSPAVAFNSGLGCTVGQLSPQSTPNLVECDATQAALGGSSGPFVTNLTASGSGSSTALSLNWKAAAFSPSQSLTCTAGMTFGMDKLVAQGAPLFSDYGYGYVSDDRSMVKYTPSGSGGTGTCAWGVANPANAAMISWNAVALPPRGSYGGGYYLVGQGTAGLSCCSTSSAAARWPR